MTLLETVAGLLARTYAMDTEGVQPARFVIGDRGLRRLYAGTEPLHKVGSALPAGAGAKTLVRETPEGLRASIYLPDRLVRCLERHPPQHGLGAANVDAFATLVEELDHFLLIAARARSGRPLTLFELELHANVSKHLVLARFLAGKRKKLTAERRAWLRRQLFEGVDYVDDDAEIRSRYQDAARWAVRFLDSLRALAPRESLDRLRTFHHANATGKLELIHSLA